jgi:hypothetical protein
VELRCVLPSVCLAWIGAAALTLPTPSSSPMPAPPGGWPEGRLLVVAFVGAECPLAELYAGRLAEMAAAFGPRGVGFVGLAPNRRDSAAAIARFAEAHHIPFPIHADPGGALAARLGATRTPSVVVLDERRTIRYRGRIDDQYARSARRAEPIRHDLARALEALLAGRPVDPSETEAIGCPIEGDGSGPEAESSTYERDVAPILRRRCVSCHSKGQIAPFGLTTYRQAAGWAGAMAEAVEERRMPPWHADPAYGTFANDAHLTDREIATLVDWARGGCPRGEGEAVATESGPPPAPSPEGWSIPGPDLVLTMPRPFRVPAGGIVDYQQFEVDPGFDSDRWISAAEIRPGNRRVVHHCTVFLKPPGADEPEMTPGPLGSFCLAATALGTPPMVLPPGMAKRIPAGWRLLFVVHYTTTGTPQTDRTSLGLTFASPSRVQREVATHLLYDPDLRIPPGAPDHRVEKSWRAPADLLLLAMFPHMHLRGKSFRYEADYPDGRTETLLFVPRYDFNWQHRYVLATPKRIPAGTTLRCVARYDNSAANPANPDPRATVRTGKQSADEMFNGYFDVALADQDLTRTTTPAATATATATFPSFFAVSWPRLPAFPRRPLPAMFLTLAACGLALGLDRLGRTCRRSA